MIAINQQVKRVIGASREQHKAFKMSHYPLQHIMQGETDVDPFTMHQLNKRKEIIEECLIRLKQQYEFFKSAQAETDAAINRLEQSGEKYFDEGELE